MEIWLILAATGTLAGFMAGLLGIGGGFVIVPLLLMTLPQTGIDPRLATHVAVGTSLVCISFTSLSSSHAHNQKKAIDWTLLKPITPGLIIGALAGAAVAGVLKGPILVLIFVLGAITTAIYLLSGHQTKQVDRKTSAYVYFLFANFTGVISALIGIGGGSILVPFLVYRGRAMVKAVGTAAAGGFPIAVAGGLGFIYEGWQETKPIEYATGYVYWPAVLGIVIFSTLSAPLGVKLAHFIRESYLRVIFAIFLILTSGQILYSQWFSNP